MIIENGLSYNPKLENEVNCYSTTPTQLNPAVGKINLTKI